MTAYRYFGLTQTTRKPPAADAIMDELAEHLLERDSLEDALVDLCRRGVEERFGPKFGPESDRLDGLDDLASRLQKQRRRLLNEYDVQPLLDDLAEEIRSLIGREVEAVGHQFHDERNKIDEKSEKLLKKVAAAVKKMEKLREASPGGEGGLSRLENKFEEMFLRHHEILSESRELAKDEAARMEALKDLPSDPGEALKRLRDYEPVDPTVGEALSSLAEMADEIGAIERVHAQPGFGGSRPVDLDGAGELVNKVLGIERLGSKIRSGNLSLDDESLLSETLGPQALESAGMISKLRDELFLAGYLKDDGDGLKLSPRAMRRLGQKALLGVFSNLEGGRIGRHETALSGRDEPDSFHTRKYCFGDSFNIHLGATLMNSLKRGSGGPPVAIGPGDFEVYDEQHSADCSTVLLLDLSHTMSQNCKLPAAKKVVLALDSLIRTRFPRDRLYIAGFSTFARELSPEDLPHAAVNPGSPFTNIKDGLRLAAEMISRDRGRNRQVILITDGEPSAYYKDGRLHIDYPPSEEIFTETLKEVSRLTRMGIVINTFMLDEKPTLVRFVRRMARLNKGRVFFSSPGNLGEYLLVDYLARHKRMLG